MDFFQHQDQARSQTRKLIVLFILAVLSLIVITNLLIMFVFGYANSDALLNENILDQFDWDVFIAVAVVVSLVVLIGSLYKIAELSSGGTAVAEALDAKLIVRGTSDLNQQRVLNVVEEMAIASGTPVPPVYLLDESAINAFAAGFSPSDAVIGITRGAVDVLTREQLQGVIAHEFSHILNGDMRLNIRLIGVLHGILVIGTIGYYMMRGSSRSRDKEGAGLALLGLGLMAIGYAGTFFGNMIKSAVSREREYLADASAVQFTRNPDGISGALVNIGASQFGSTINNPEAPEISHCLFGQGVEGFFTGLFATHPPLAERIKRVKPSWDGRFIANKRAQKPADSQEPATADGQDRKASLAITAAAILAANTDGLNREQLEAATSILGRLPQTFRDSVQDPYGARAVIYVLVLDTDEQIRQRQCSHLEFNADKGMNESVAALYADRTKLEEDAFLPLIEMALPSLRQLSKPQYELFVKILERLIDMDGRVSLFEWIMSKIVRHHLDAIFSGKAAVRAKYRSVKQLTSEIGLVISLLVCNSRQGSVGREENFGSACNALGLESLALIQESEIAWHAVDAALDKLNQLLPMEKHLFMKACAAAIMADRIVQPKEAELYRMISEVLDSPVPPVGQG